MHACCRSHSLHTWYVWMLVFFFVIACFVVIRSLLSPFYVNSISFAWSAAAEKKSLIIFCLNWLNHLPATFYSWFHYRRLNIGHTTFDYIYKQIKCLTQLFGFTIWRGQQLWSWLYGFFVCRTSSAYISLIKIIILFFVWSTKVVYVEINFIQCNQLLNFFLVDIFKCNYILTMNQ